jgi:hypothetical protein
VQGVPADRTKTCRQSLHHATTTCLLTRKLHRDTILADSRSSCQAKTPVLSRKLRLFQVTDDLCLSKLPNASRVRTPEVFVSGKSMQYVGIYAMGGLSTRSLVGICPPLLIQIDIATDRSPVYAYPLLPLIIHPSFSETPSSHAIR